MAKNDPDVTVRIQMRATDAIQPGHGTLGGTMVNVCKCGQPVEDDGAMGLRHVPWPDGAYDEIRVWLWERDPHTGKYGDDGELQCFGTDFRRMPLKDLIEHVIEAAVLDDV